jgi:hypothetical protein
MTNLIYPLDVVKRLELKWTTRYPSSPGHGDSARLVNRRAARNSECRENGALEIMRIPQADDRKPSGDLKG